MVLIGLIFKNLTSISGLGIFDRILGFVFGASKFFLIAAVIAFATYNIKAMRSTIDSAMEGSFMFPILVKTGDVIMQIDPVSISQDINETIDTAVDSATLTIVNETKKKLAENFEHNESNNSDEEIQ